MNELFRFLRQDKILFYSVILFAVILLFYLFGGFNWIKFTSFYNALFDFYVNIVGKISVFLIWVFNDNVTYIPELKSLKINGNDVIELYTNFSLRYNLYLFVVLIILPGKRLQSVVYFVLSVLFIILLMGVKCSFEVVFHGQSKELLGDSFLVFRSLLLYFAFVYKIKINGILLSAYKSVNDKMITKFNFSIFYFLFFLIILLPVSRLFELIDLSLLTNTIIDISQYINAMLGYSSYVVDRYIIMDKNWVYLGDPCLGIGVLLIFFYLIFSVKSRFINQFIYIIAGGIFMVVMNAVRISFLLIHIYKTGYYDYQTDPHALSNYFFYSVVFLLFLIYIYWFQDLRFKKVK